MLLKKKILIIDDYQPILETLKDILKNHYEVDTAENGFIALDKIHSKNFDLIILDLIMPKISGFEILQKINYLKKPVLIFSGRPKIAETIENIKNPFIQYINKPFEKSVLYFQINHLLKIYNLHMEHNISLEKYKRYFKISKASIREINNFFSIFSLEKIVWEKFKTTLIKKNMDKNLLNKSIKILDNLFTNLSKSKKIFNRKLLRLINLKK